MTEFVQSEDSSTLEGEVETPDWIWVSPDGAVTRELAPPDPLGTPLKDFRAREAQAVVDVLSHSDRKIVVARANSGYGISRFFIPKLSDVCQPLNISVVHDLRVDKRVVKAGKFYKEGTLLVIDEPGSQLGTFGSEEGYIKKFLKKSKDIRLLLIHDWETDPEFHNMLVSLNHSHGPIVKISVEPKLFNEEQTAEYFAWGRPYDRDRRSAVGYFKEVNKGKLWEAAHVYHQYFPAHFRLIDFLRGFPPRKNMTGMSRGQVMTPDERIQELSPGGWVHKTLTDHISDPFYSGVAMGIIDRRTIRSEAA